ncbi:ferredoxin [Synergistales bacterium]|nr:ferredoxin [Synergistales bacterium]
MKVSLDSKRCIGCGVCCQICPDIFRLNEASGVAEVSRPETTEDTAKEAEGSCPVSCIIVA